MAPPPTLPPHRQLLTSQVPVPGPYNPVVQVQIPGSASAIQAPLIQPPKLPTTPGYTKAHAEYEAFTNHYKALAYTHNRGLIGSVNVLLTSGSKDKVVRVCDTLWIQA